MNHPQNSKRITEAIEAVSKRLLEMPPDELRALILEHAESPLAKAIEYALNPEMIEEVPDDKR